MKVDPQHQPGFEAFLQGREPLFVWRFERHTRDAEPRTTRRQGVHPYAVVILVTEGRSRMHHSGDFELRPGDVHVIPPGDAHSGAHFEAATGWALSFWPEQSQHSLRLFSQVRGGCHPVVHTTTRQRKRLERWIDALQEELGANREGRSDAIASLLRLLMLDLVRASSTSLRPPTEPSNLARRALDVIERRALKPLGLADVAREVARTPAHVANVVREETGRTVGEWIRVQRMAEARRRLRESDEPIEVVAQQVGYQDVTHFIRQFRKEHGQTPARWRRESVATEGKEPRKR